MGSVLHLVAVRGKLSECQLPTLLRNLLVLVSPKRQVGTYSMPWLVIRAKAAKAGNCHGQAWLGWKSLARNSFMLS